MRLIAFMLLWASPVFAADVFAPDAKLKVESAKGEGGEGPAWHPLLGVLTSGNGNICRLSPDGKASIFREEAGTNGLLWDADGRLLACEPRYRRVTRTDASGKITVLADKFNGKKFNQPNDITVDAKGRIYFTDPCYGDRSQLEMTDADGRVVEGVYRIDLDGKVSRIIGRELERPNGILVSGDGNTLYVADNNNDKLGAARKLYRFDLQADGAVNLKSKKLLHDWKDGRGPDGLKQDSKGRLFVAGGLNKPNPPAEPSTTVKGGIYVFESDGTFLEFLPVPTDEVTNCAFGGEDLKTLYITGGGTLYSIRVQNPGRVVYSGKK